MIARAKYTVAKWEETPYQQPSPTTKMTKASVEFILTGEIDGKASVEYLMYYKYSDPADPHKSSAVYLGLIRFEGELNGKKGSFILEDRGAFKSGAANSTLKIIEGSGLADLTNIRGSGSYLADSSGARMELEYQL
jgi:hypothetical protein